MQKRRNQRRKDLKQRIYKHMLRTGLLNEQDRQDRRVIKNLNEDVDDVMKLKDKRGALLYRQDSFKRLLKNDSLKYHENGMQEVFDEF